jgi:glycerol-3-phosphate dehydrogenase subunit C
MTLREGSLEAPTRHALDWTSEDFYDEDKLFAELERVYGICHGCRRCVNLCTAFPRLFDLIDEGPTGELDGVDKSRYWEVVDRCYLCDLCYMTKCPYVPPHPWNVDFPHLQLRAKAAKFRNGQPQLRDRMLSNTDRLGKLATIPVVVKFVNAANKSTAARATLDKVFGVHRDRVLPEYAHTRFRSEAMPNSSLPVRDGVTAPGKVALFATCYVNYNEPSIGHDLLAVLAHNDIPVILACKEVCCGMPKLELGDFESVARAKAINVPVLAALATQGYALLTPVPSCTLMFKQELPLMFPHDSAVAAVARATFDPFEYLVLRHKDGLLKTDFRNGLGRVSYHVPCHLRVQNMGQKTRELLQMVPGTELNTVERCSGHDGTWGVKSEFFEQSMKIGRPVFRQMADSSPDYISSDCAIAGRHIEQGMAIAAGKKRHPISLLRLAYGI